MTGTCEDESGSCLLEQVRNLSSVCVAEWNDRYDYTPARDTCCYPLPEPVSVVAGVWCVLNAVVGFTGNLLTLLAIPLAKKNNRFGFRDTCDCTTLFILNLAFSDLIYCSFNLPLYSVQYLTQSWPLSHGMCYAFAAFRYINAFADWMSLAFIAVSRCVGLIWGDHAEKYLSGMNGLAVITLIWAYAIGLVSLALFDVVGDFGYNCRSGKCDFIAKDGSENIDPHRFYYGIAFTIPCIIIFVCYLTIWCYVKHSARYLKKNSSDALMRGQIEQREMKMTWTLLLVSLCYLICVGPIAICNVADPTANYPEVHLAFFCIYWLQYSLNFFIYAMRSEQFRTAYWDFLYTMWFHISRLLRCHCFGKSDAVCHQPSRRTLVYVHSRRSAAMGSKRRKSPPNEHHGDVFDLAIPRRIFLEPPCGCNANNNLAAGQNVIQTISLKIHSEKVQRRKARILDVEAAVSSEVVPARTERSDDGNFKIVIVERPPRHNSKAVLKRLYSLDKVESEADMPHVRVIQQRVKLEIRRRSLSF